MGACDIKPDIVTLGPDEKRENSHDTKNKCNNANVSYGYWNSGLNFTLSDGKKISFTKNKLMTATSIDERYLTHCLYLNLNSSSLKFLNTENLGALRVLHLYEVKLKKLDAVYLVNLEYLNIGYTCIRELNTDSLAKL